MKLRQNIVAFVLPFIFITEALSENYLCVIEELKNDVYKEFLIQDEKTSKWKILDYVLREKHLEKAKTCFNNWSRTRMNNLKQLNDLKKENKIKETKFFYSPASNYGYARVNVYKKDKKLYVKESFYIDYKGHVYDNNIFYIEFNEFYKPNFYEYDNRNGVINQRDIYCLRCHKERIKHRYLFKNY